MELNDVFLVMDVLEKSDILKDGQESLILNEPEVIIKSTKPNNVFFLIKDPKDIIMDGVIIAKWEGTKIIRKKGNIPPIDENDGILIEDNKVRDKYSSIPFIDKDTEIDNIYSYGFFPYTSSYRYNTKCTKIVNVNDAITFAMRIRENDTNPNNMVYYPEGYDNSDYKPLKKINNKLELGDWKDAFFLPKSCMLKSDGNVDYYLDENNHKSKMDGKISDIHNVYYDGAAMMEWGQDGPFYWKYEPDDDGKGGLFVISTKKLDDKMDAWNFYNYKGELSNHFYTSKYNYEFNIPEHEIKIKSLIPINQNINGNFIKRKTIIKNSINEIKDQIRKEYELENWGLETFMDRTLINFLLILMGKSLNIKSLYGNTKFTENDELIDDIYGLFYSDDNINKIFGMHNFINIPHWIDNIFINKNDKKLYIKNKVSDEYKNTEISFNTFGRSIKSLSFISKMNHLVNYIIPKDYKGASNLYYTCSFASISTKNMKEDYVFMYGGDINSGMISLSPSKEINIKNKSKDIKIIPSGTFRLTYR